MYIFAHSWGRPTARYLLKQALEPEILRISLQKFKSMFLNNYTFEISKKKIDFSKIPDHHLALTFINLYPLGVCQFSIFYMNAFFLLSNLISIL